MLLYKIVNFFYVYFKINFIKDWNFNQKLGVKLKLNIYIYRLWIIRVIDEEIRYNERQNEKLFFI